MQTAAILNPETCRRTTAETKPPIYEEIVNALVLILLMFMVSSWEFNTTLQNYLPNSWLKL